MKTQSDQWTDQQTKNNARKMIHHDIPKQKRRSHTATRNLQHFYALDVELSSCILEGENLTFVSKSALSINLTRKVGPHFFSRIYISRTIEVGLIRRQKRYDADELFCRISSTRRQREFYTQSTQQYAPASIVPLHLRNHTDRPRVRAI